MIPDAPELIGNFLETEQDASCKRNAFMMLIHVDQDRALQYLSGCMDQVGQFNDILQLVIVELIYKVCHNNPAERARFIRCVYNLLSSSSAAVRYEAAGTLLTLSSAPTAVKAVASCYIDLIVKESDNNVKLIVLGRLMDMKDDPVKERVLQDMIMDILRVLGSSDLEVCRKTLNLALDLVTARTVNEMVMVLRKEAIKTASAVEQEETGKFRQLLVQTLHQCSCRFPDVAPQVIPALSDFLTDQLDTAATDVMMFMREAGHRFDNLRPIVVSKILEVLPSVKNAKIFRSGLWILGEYCHSADDIQAVMCVIRQTLGELPIVEDEIRRAAGDDTEEEIAQVATQAPRKLVTEMGTYATQTAFSVNQASKSSSKAKDRPALRKFLLEGDFFIGAALGTVLCKLAFRFNKLSDHKKLVNGFSAEAMLVVASILHLGRSGLPDKPMTDDDAGHLECCLRTLCDQVDEIGEVFTAECSASLGTMLGGGGDIISDAIAKASQKKKDSKVRVHVDDAVNFLQLLGKSDVSNTENLFDLTLSQALGTAKSKEQDVLTSTKLSKVKQLSGFSDPVYCEAYVNVNQYDIVLDVFVVNQTGDNLQNLTLELATLGDLKLVEKPQPITLAGHDFTNFKAAVKVASTENGIIFGNIVYDVKGAASDRSVVVLNDIHIDIMDYLVPAVCSDAEFRQMWADFEWENKVTVSTSMTDPRAYLAAIVKGTNMKSLTPEKALAGDCGFLAANLYARSIFGEDALANVSLECPQAISNEGAALPVMGHIRIRAKSQGMALSLGDKISALQRQMIKGKPKEQSEQKVSTSEN